MHLLLVLLHRVVQVVTIKHENVYFPKNVRRTCFSKLNTTISRLRSVRNMMYGFGDDSQPYAESVELLEDLVIQYITDMVNYFRRNRFLSKSTLNFSLDIESIGNR